MGYYGWGYPMSPVKIDAKDARINELEAALRPFADIAAKAGPDDIWLDVNIYCDDLRAARAALEKKND